MPLTDQAVLMLLDDLRTLMREVREELARHGEVLAGSRTVDVVVPPFEMPAMPRWDAGEIAAALAPVMAQGDRHVAERFEELREAMSEVAVAVKAMKPQSIRTGGGGAVRVYDANGAAVDLATQGTLLDVKRALTDMESRFDYDTRTDKNPVYIGKALQGTATSANSWTVTKFDYDSSNRPTRIQVETGVWDNRATLF